jgi:Uma2 family endonuclease
MATHEIRPSPSPRIELGPGDAGRAVSAEEFADAVLREPWRYERASGSLVVMAPDGEGHVDAVDPWLERLFAYRANHREVVRRVVPNAWIRVDEGTDRIADIGVYLAEEGDAGSRPIPDRVPELVFEVVSPGRVPHDRDYVEKRAEYERLGVREYVVVDRFRRQVTVFALTPDGYRAEVRTAADAYASPLLPGLAIPLAEVLNP